MRNIIKNICLIIIISLPIIFPSQVSAESGSQKQQPLILGILPFRSPVALLKRFTPLRNYLQDKLGTPVVIETARNYEEFVDRTRERRYDFVLTAPHFTLLAIETGKYKLLATYLKPLAAGISVRSDSNIRHISQLQGKTISTPPELAVITMVGKAYLKQNLKKTVNFISYESHSASIDTMLAGKSVAAIASLNPTRQYMQRKAPIRIIARSPSLPGMGLLAARDLDKNIIARYKKALITMHKNPSGKQALVKMGYPGYRTTTQKEFEPARRFLEK